MAPSFRDRFLSPKVARAITSPSAIVAAGAGAAIGVLTGLGPIAAVVGGVVAFAGRVGFAIPRRPRPDRIDPFTLGDPWNRLVQDALAAQRQFDDAVRRARGGPLKERLDEIAQRIDDGVADCWRIAQSGNALADARRRIDVPAAERDLAEVRATSSPDNPTTRQTVAAIEAQLQSAQRLDKTITDTRDHLRLLNARLDEAVSRSIELSVGTTTGGGLAAVESDVSAITSELEALRQALDTTAAVDVAGSGGTALGGAAGGPG